MVKFLRYGLLGVTFGLCGLLTPTAASAIESKPFGIESLSTQTTETNPEDVNVPYLFTQAGGHPWALTSSVQFASEEASGGHRAVVGDPKNVIIDLPPGLVADPQAVVRCSGAAEHCPTDSQVGVFTIRFATGESEASVLGAIFNMTPTPNEAAELGLEVPFIGRMLLAGRLVHGATGYSLAIIGHGLPVFNIGGSSPPLHILSIETTLWGVPAATAHDPQRGIFCFGLSGGGGFTCQGGGLSSGEEAVPFLTMPSTCSTTGPTTVAWTDSWEEPDRYVRAESTLPALGDCQGSPFSPEVVVHPETSQAEAPDGIGATIMVPQFDGSIAGAPPLRGATITLPQGMSINPSVADGLQGCDPTGPSGINIPTGVNADGEPLQPGEVGPGEEIPPQGLGPEEPLLAPGHCPDASTIGTAEASTPLLANPIKGRIYIATPRCGGPDEGVCDDQDAVDGNLYRLYIELGGKGTEPYERGQGVLIKLEATVQASPATGQLTVQLLDSPQLPISQLNLRLFGGGRSLLANPTTCGAATTTTALEPWSAPYTPDSSPSSYFNVTGCTPTTLNPRFLAGSVNAMAGAPTQFTLTIARHTGEPYLSAIQVRTPHGLSAKLAGIAPCNETLANTGGCPEASRIGDSIVATGVGWPLQMPGTIYLTGPYKGAPFGLSIVTNAQAGPLNLGTVIIRARVNIDPQTAALTITTDPLPQIVLGVPLRIQSVTLTLTRPDFILNPTNCNEQHITGIVAGTQGSSASVSNRFALAGCRSLTFNPTLKASTTAHAGYTRGASLDLKLTFPKTTQGNEANPAQIKVTLPKQLSTRLTTLQHSCPDTTFNTDPSACPQASIIGIAKARTPLLPGEMTGPVYLLSHGHNIFPSPTAVLQGDGVRLDLPGTTLINNSRTSVAFKTIPDMPVQNIEINLPQGPHSLLTANTTLCPPMKTDTVTRDTQRNGLVVAKRVATRSPAGISTTSSLIAQNGLAVHRNTKIHVIGCATHTAKTARPAGPHGMSSRARAHRAQT